MRQLVLFVVVFSFMRLGAIAQEPIEVYRDSNIIESIYFEDVHIDGDKVYFWSKTDYNGDKYIKKVVKSNLKVEFRYSDDVDIDKWMTFSFEKTYQVMNTKTRKSFLLAEVYYTRNGDVIKRVEYEEPSENNWNYIIPGTIEDVCFKSIKTYVSRNKPFDPEAYIQAKYGMDGKTLKEKIKRGEITLPTQHKK